MSSWRPSYQMAKNKNSTGFTPRRLLLFYVRTPFSMLARQYREHKLSTYLNTGDDSSFFCAQLGRWELRASSVQVRRKNKKSTGLNTRSTSLITITGTVPGSRSPAPRLLIADQLGRQEWAPGVQGGQIKVGGADNPVEFHYSGIQKDGQPRRLHFGRL